MSIKIDKIVKTALKSFKKGDVDFTISELSKKDDMLKVVVTASRNGIDLPINNPVYVKNPPLMVPNGKKIKVKDEISKKEIEIDEFEENPAEALKEILNGLIK